MVLEAVVYNDDVSVSVRRFGCKTTYTGELEKVHLFSFTKFNTNTKNIYNTNNS